MYLPPYVSSIPKGHSRFMLRHTFHVVVMEIVEFLLGEGSSIIQLMLSLLGPYVVKLVKLTSKSILVEEG